MIVMTLVINHDMVHITVDYKNINSNINNPIGSTFHTKLVKISQYNS